MAQTTGTRITRGPNPYREGVQGQANEPITVAALLDRAHELAGLPHLGWSLGEIWDRLEANAPRVAVIGGSPDHPAHLQDPKTGLLAAHRIWARGGVPFMFSVPVMCDGTAQSNLGMCYSLQSRLAVAQMVVNQMESHSYHGAFVLQGCDKTPTGVLAGLVHLDALRQRRGEAPVMATFAPGHVLKGGTIPPGLKERIADLARRCQEAGQELIAGDLLVASDQILQCVSNVIFEGAFKRAVQVGLLGQAEWKAMEKELAIRTCDPKGGICAFYGTGNSSRVATSALGLVHPALELLTGPAGPDQVNPAVDALLGFCDRPEFSVGSLVAQNMPNCARVFSATGGSTNLVMHLVAVMIYAGYDFSLESLDRLRTRWPVPDLFDYSLTQGRDIFALAGQVQAGLVRGVETVIHSLKENKVPMNLAARTVTGTDWQERLKNTRGLPAEGVKENPIILPRPRRPFSGIDLLGGNWFETAVVKISGMPDEQLDRFDEKLALVLYYSHEEEANVDLLKPNLLRELWQSGQVPARLLPALAGHNRLTGQDLPPGAAGEDLFNLMIREGLLKLAVVIAGQGPEAFGMPEMFTPMQHINANARLKPLASVISDGRYSGTSFGAAIGHVTPEAIRGGGILYLETGDVLLLSLRKRKIDLLDPEALAQGRVEPFQGDLAIQRSELGRKRRVQLRERQRLIAASNRLQWVTDAARGVVPLAVAREAKEVYEDPTPEP